jgi:amidohydrolase
MCIRDRDLFEYSQNIRRDLHRFPEIGFQEFRTQGIILEELKKLKIESISSIAETGVRGLLKGNNDGPVLLLRFDMDALPVMEESDADYKSCIPGRMHACGHDGHVAVGLTVARLLSGLKDKINGQVKFMFQPAEEGLGGAERMLAEGILENPRPDYALAVHLWNGLKTGKVGAVAGPVKASSDIFTVNLKGRGGHGAMPDQTTDPLVASAQIVSALQTIVSRNISPLDTAVVSVASLPAGDTFNVIPSTAELKGTIRTYSKEVREQIVSRFRQIVEGISKGMGCDCTIEIQSITPAVINDNFVVDQVYEAVKNYLPKGNFDLVPKLTMASEDFAFVLEKIPGAYLFVGSAALEKGEIFGHHHPKFDIDETSLVQAASLIVASALQILNSKS